MKSEVAVRVFLYSLGEAEINAWSLGLEHYCKRVLSQGEWARMSLPDIYTSDDWYDSHEDLDRSKSYELYIEGKMTGSFDQFTGEADEELDIHAIQFRELTEDELLPEMIQLGD